MQKIKKAPSDARGLKTVFKLRPLADENMSLKGMSLRERASKGGLWTET